MGTTGRGLTIGIGVFFVGLGLLFSLNQPGGPTSETTGIVQSLGSVPSDTAPPSRTATVRLLNGTTVQADVPLGAALVPGQSARLRVYRRVVTDTEAYEVIGVEGK